MVKLFNYKFVEEEGLEPPSIDRDKYVFPIIP